MLLYHGSNVVVENPKILTPSRSLDFGPGFYVTSNKPQAERWSSLTTRRRGIGVPTVSVYEFDERAANQLLTLSFSAPTADWLNFVTANRKNTYRGPKYDLVIGPVANDRTMAVINDYMVGNIDERTALVLLLPQKLHDQHAFLSYRALTMLHYVGGETIGS